MLGAPDHLNSQHGPGFWHGHRPLWMAPIATKRVSIDSKAMLGQNVAAIDAAGYPVSAPN